MWLIVATALAADPSPVKWQTAEGISVTTEDGSIVIRSTDVEFGWATTEQSEPVVADLKCDVKIAGVKDGQLTVQLEWFRENGEFLSATPLQKDIRGPVTITKPVADLLPTGEKPGRVRYKFWIEGKQAEIKVAHAKFAAP
jgi:hypothetical protein